jgi:hypothetical protein
MTKITEQNEKRISDLEKKMMDKMETIQTGIGNLLN